VLAVHEALDGTKKCVSHVPAATELVSKIAMPYPPEPTVKTVVPELFLTTTEPLDWLLLNSNSAPIGSVVASGNWYV